MVRTTHVFRKSGGPVQAFIWSSRATAPPECWDLRLLGWTLLDRSAAEATEGRYPQLFDCRPASRAGDWSALAHPDLTAAVGANEPEERAAMLEFGLGEALSSHISLLELAARLARLVAMAGALPRYIAAGPLTLDLFHREGYFRKSRLALHPREFALLWRLAKSPGQTVSRHQLLADVWQLEHVPETNSLEVHVSRLRAKLASAGLARLVETAPGGGYRLRTGTDPALQASGPPRVDTRRSLGDARRTSLIESAADGAE